MHYTNKPIEQSPSAEANTNVAGRGFLYFLLIRYRQGRGLSLVNTFTLLPLHIYIYINIILPFSLMSCNCLLQLCLQRRAEKLLIIQLIKNFCLFHEAIILIKIA